MNRYYKAHWNESSGEQLTGLWGTSDYFLEVDGKGYPVRQIQLFENGNQIKYDETRLDDVYGGLGDQSIDHDEFPGLTISKEEFEQQWAQKSINWNE